VVVDATAVVDAAVDVVDGDDVGGTVEEVVVAACCVVEGSVDGGTVAGIDD
jgi:hypothetical protein